MAKLKRREPEFYEQTEPQVTELCGGCDYEITEFHNIELDGKTITCPRCGRINAICSMCKERTCLECKYSTY